MEPTLSADVERAGAGYHWRARLERPVEGAFGATFTLTLELDRTAAAALEGAAFARAIAEVVRAAAALRRLPGEP